MGAAVWPDLVKTDTAHYFNNGYVEDTPASISDKDGKRDDGKLPMHKSWHFIDTPYNLDTKVDGPPLDGKLVDVVQVLTVLDKQLKQPISGKAEKAYENVSKSPSRRGRKSVLIGVSLLSGLRVFMRGFHSTTTP